VLGELVVPDPGAAPGEHRDRREAGLGEQLAQQLATDEACRADEEGRLCGVHGCSACSRRRGRRREISKKKKASEGQRARGQRGESTMGSPSARPRVPCITQRGVKPGRSRGVKRWASIASNTWLSSSEKLLPMQIRGPAA